MRGQAQGVGGDQRGPRLRELFHPGGNMGRRPHRGIVVSEIAVDRAHDDLTRIHPYPDLDIDIALAPKRGGVATHRRLHPHRGQTTAHGMVRTGQGGAEERHDAVTHHLVDGASVVMDGFHHPLEHAVEDRPRLFEVAAGQQLQRAAQIGEEHGEECPFALQSRARGEQIPPTGLLLEAALDAPQESLRVVSLLKVVDGPQLHCFFGRFPAGVRGEQDDVRLGAMRLRRPEHVEADAIRHSQIGHHEIGRIAGEDAHGGGHPVRFAHPMASRLEEQRHRGPRGRLVVHHEDRRHAVSGDSHLVPGRGRGGRGFHGPSRGGGVSEPNIPFRSETAGCLHGASMPYSFSLRQRVVRPMPSASAVRE
jgi:hypothetical protein